MKIELSAIGSEGRCQNGGVGRQETGDRRQETGSRRQETGDRRQETELRSVVNHGARSSARRLEGTRTENQAVYVFGFMNLCRLKAELSQGRAWSRLPRGRAPR